MIAIIEPGESASTFVALHLAERLDAGLVWVPIPGEPVALPSLMDAAERCVEALQAQAEPLVMQARLLSHLCSVVERPRTADEQANGLSLSRELAHGLVRVWSNLSRLLDQPRVGDTVAYSAHGVAEKESTRIEERAPQDGDDGLLTVNQLRAGRAITRLGVRQLASASGLSAAAISQIENLHTDAPHKSTLQALRKALESHGVEFGAEGWIRHVTDADARLRSAQPSQRAAYVQAVDLLEVTRRLLEQVTHLLRNPASKRS